MSPPLPCLIQLKGITREIISSQATTHEKFGGVVPDLASRMHLTALPLLLEEFRNDIPNITTLAVTRGPGLLPCLSMGISMTRALSVALNCPIQTVNHLRAHVHSVFINLHATNPAKFTQARAALLLTSRISRFGRKYVISKIRY
jgi:N6-L-threonylcarbamoyladenine synthase